MEQLSDKKGFRINAWYFAALATAAFIVGAPYVVPAGVGGAVSGFDKIVHFAEFLVLAVFICLAAAPAWEGKKVYHPALIAVVACTVIGGLDEAVQYFVPSRDAAWGDIAADAAGALVAAVLWSGRSLWKLSLARFVLFLLFVVFPMAEIGVIVAIAHVLAWPWILLIVLVTAFAGSMLLVHYGASTFKKAKAEISVLQVPHETIIDGFLIVVGGAFLLTPGFITDTLGFLLVIPPTRKLFREMIIREVKKRIKKKVSGIASSFGGPEKGPAPEDGVIDAEFVKKPGNGGA